MLQGGAGCGTLVVSFQRDSVYREAREVEVMESEKEELLWVRDEQNVRW